METVSDPTTSEAIAALAAAVDTLQSVGVTPSDEADARRLISVLEVQARRVRAAQVQLLEEIDRSGLHASDGHASAKVMVRHVARLSGPEADRRARAAKALRHLPGVRAAFAAGTIGSCQVDRIARVHANPRVRAAVEVNEASFVDQAQATDNDYRSFDLMVGDWERLMDEDGTRDRNQRSHDTRDAKIRQGFDGSWDISGGCASLQGVELHAILQAFTKAEFHADWTQARAQKGDAATTADLDRTDGQRRFDALLAIFRKAADAHAAAPGGSQIVTNLVIDQATFERITAQLAGATTDPVHSPFPSPSYRCDTLDGNPVEATEAVAQALIGHVRRVVVGADSVVIDLGRKRRLFTGSAALAVKLSTTCCYWKGCWVPVTDCDSDHLEPWTPEPTAGAEGVPTRGTRDPAAGDTTDTRRTASPSTATRPEPSTSTAPTAPRSTDRAARAAPPRCRRMGTVGAVAQSEGGRAGTSTLAYLYGPPAAGKLTIAEHLAERTGFRLFHNHLTVNALTPVFAFRSAPFDEVLHRVRLDVFATAAGAGVDLIFTNSSVWGGAQPRADFVAFAEEVRRTVEARGGQVRFVQVIAADAELEARVAGDSRRAHGKLVDPSRLREVLAQHDPTPLHPDDLVIRSDRLEPAEAARQIAADLADR